MLALVIVAVGLLGIAGASSLSLRALATHDASLRATRRVSLRIASLEAGGCATARDGVGTEAPDGIREAWHVTPVNGAALMIDDSVAWTSAGRPRVLVVRGALLC